MAGLVAVLALAAGPVDFDRDIRPILERRCISCHGSKSRKAGLRLDLRADALAGGDSGPAWVAGKSEESLVVEKVSATDPAERMPPEGDPLTPDEIQALRGWIDQGAEWPVDGAGASQPTVTDHWAFRPVRRP